MTLCRLKKAKHGERFPGKQASKCQTLTGCVLNLISLKGKKQGFHHWSLKNAYPKDPRKMDTWRRLKKHSKRSGMNGFNGNFQPVCLADRLVAGLSQPEKIHKLRHTTKTICVSLMKELRSNLRTHLMHKENVAFQNNSGNKVRKAHDTRGTKNLFISTIRKNILGLISRTSWLA
eukprot:1137139-Pelagomonas_calceolata.AAC.12